MSSVHILGIRHHGPGSARSLRAALDEIRPSIILIEGPPDANTLIELAGYDEMQPPVALLIYSPEDTRQAVYYPFAVYSPEYQAMQWALTHNIDVAFMDLPQKYVFAYQQQKLAELDKELKQREAEMEQAHEAGDDAGALNWLEQVEQLRQRMREEMEQRQQTEAELDIAEQVRRDPLGWLGRAAGYNDGERWWEHVIEQRRDDLIGVFDAVLEAMTEVRETAGDVIDDSEARREAFMRKTIRKAQRDGYKRIAVVCGAWHSPALAEGTALYKPTKDDNALLRNMPKVKVEATWIPWTNGRLARQSGYGAGITSPGWYQHLWATEQDIVIKWLTRVATLLREQDLDASTAQIIDTVRLVETLTAIRGYALPGLEELNESIQATMLFGASEPMNLIHNKLIVGEMIGEVPSETPMVPLIRDLRDTLKRLDGGAQKKQKTHESDQIKYFRQNPETTDLNLDLRNSLDLERSQLLHRLRILEIEWGKTQKAHRGRGTFKEDWRLKWEPEYEIRLIEKSIWGNTISDAATQCVLDHAKNAQDLLALTRLVDAVLHADLPDAASELIQQLRVKAAVAADVNSMMDALIPLVDVKTGHHERLSVRKITLDDVTYVIEGLITRIIIGLLNACLSLDDDAANAMHNRIIDVHYAILRLRNETYMEQWYSVLQRLAASEKVHGLVAGRAARLLLDVNEISPEEVARLMRLAISTAAQPPAAAAWVEGFLRGSGLILLHDDELFGVIDRWIMSLKEDSFVALLPLLRRTFSTFSNIERRKLGEHVRKIPPGKRIESKDMVAVFDNEHIDMERADAMLPVIELLLGIRDEMED